MIDEKEFVKQTAEIMSDQEPIEVQISIMQAWLIISGLQLACRHPGLSKSMKFNLVKISSQFETAIVKAHPEALKLIKMGWDQEYDR